MSSADTSVVFGRSYQLGAIPMAAREPGSFISVLKGVLVDGWGELGVLSMTYDPSSGLVEMLFAEEHHFEEAQVVLVTGSEVEPFNGRWRLEGRSTLTASFRPPAPLPAAASGTITCRVAPAGWAIAHEDEVEPKIIFRSASGDHLLVDETTTDTTAGVESCRVGMVRNVEGVDSHATFAGLTTEGMFKTYATYSPITTYGTGQPIPYLYIADDRGLYFFVKTGNSSHEANWAGCYWGSIVDNGIGPRVVAIAQRINASATSSRYDYDATNLGTVNGYTYYSTSYAAAYRRLSQTDIGTNRAFQLRRGDVNRAGTGPYLFPNPSNEFLYERNIMVESDNVCYGYMPGYAVPLHNNPLSHWSTVSLQGGRYKAVNLLAPAAGSVAAGSNGQIMIAIDKPWH